MAITETTYKIDKSNRIIEVSSGWDQFASENGGQGAASEEVLGYNLATFISGDSTLMWMMALIGSVRLHKRTATKFYRCDSPSEKRYMKMTVMPAEQGELVISNKLLRVEKMKKTVTIKYDDQSAIERCSVCNKIYVEHIWLEPDDAIVLGYLNNENNLHVIYSVCNTCSIMLNLV